MTFSFFISRLFNGRSSSMESNMSCRLKIDTRIVGWHRTMTRVLRRIKGVSYSIDAEAGIAYVSGRTDVNRLLHKLMKAGERVELCWVNAGTENVQNYGYNTGGTEPYQDPYPYLHGCPMPHCYPPNPPYPYHHH